MNWSDSRVVMPILLMLVIVALFGLTDEGLTGWEQPAALALLIVGVGLIVLNRKGR